jgi:hypothetical protein
MLDEEAKAVQEVAKATGKGIDMVASAGGALKHLLGDSLEQLGGIVSDWARYYRYKNLLEVMDKFSRIATERGIAGKATPLPPQFALPLLEGASLESEDDVQELWAGLLANAADPARLLELKKVYVEVLRGLQPVDVRLLRALSQPDLDAAYGIHNGATLNAEVLAGIVEADVEDAQISLQTLARYGCVLDSWQNTIQGLDTGYAGFRVNNPSSNFRLSHLGHRLVSATSTA